jgi:DNA recombination protein RmuC
MTTFVSHLSNVGKSLGDSVRAFNNSIGSLERRVLPSARRFTELGVQPTERIGEPKPLEELPRDVGTLIDDAGDVDKPADTPH